MRCPAFLFIWLFIWIFVLLIYNLLGQSMSKGSQEIQSGSIKYFDQPDNVGQLMRYRENFEKNHQKIRDECYYQHRDIKLLFTYIFFAFAQEQAYNFKAIKKAIQRIEGHNKDNPYQPTLKQSAGKLKLDTKQNNIVSLVKKSHNKITSNKAMLQAWKELGEYEMIRSMSGKLTNNINIKRIQFTEQNQMKEFQIRSSNSAHNWVTILQGKETNYLIFYFNGTQAKNEKSQAEQAVIEQKQVQIQPKQKKSKGNKSKVSGAQKQVDLDTLVDQALLQDASSKNNQSVDQGITWFEVLVVIIIVAVILSEQFGIFDNFLISYNKLVGRQYFLEAFSFLDGIIFGDHQVNNL